MGNSNNKFKMRSIIELILVVRQYENIVSYLNMEFKHVYNSFLHCRINNSNECSSTFQDERGKQIIFFFRETSNLSRVFVDFHSLWGHP